MTQDILRELMEITRHEAALGAALHGSRRPQGRSQPRVRILDRSIPATARYLRAMLAEPAPAHA